MNLNSWLRTAILATLFALPVFSGCNSDVSRPGSLDNGPGKGGLGTPDTGADTDPRRGSAATGADKPGPN